MCLSFVVGAQLKSVAHMPWRAMVYKSLGTFIDDLFAFVIKMPWMHRLSCLRDDLIFFIFLYQARRSFGTHTHRARAPNTSAQARERASARARDTGHERSTRLGGCCGATRRPLGSVHSRTREQGPGPPSRAYRAGGGVWCATHENTAIL